MGDQRLGRNTAFDQSCRRRFLYYSARAGPAGELRTFGHDHPELRRDHIQPLRGVLADHRHWRPTARACGVLGFQDHLDARQVGRQCAAVGTPFDRVVLAQFRILFLRLRLFFGDRLLEGFQAQLQLFFRQTFGPGTELHPRQFQQQMA